MKSKSRLYHPPVHTHGTSQAHKSSRALIFSQQGGGRQWIEVFTDLIFAVAIMQTGASSVETFNVEQRLVAFGFTAWLGLAWFFHVVYANRFIVDDFLHRILVLSHLCCVGLLAALTPALIHGQYQNFTLFVVVAEGIAGLIYLRSLFHVQGRIGKYCQKRAALSFGLGTLWLASSLVPDYRFEIWTLALTFKLLTPFLMGLKANHHAIPLSRGHLAQRFGILVTVLLGGSVVQVFLQLYAVAGPETSLKPAAVSLVLACSLWWLYIDDIAKAIIRRGLGYLSTWLTGHIILCSSIIALRISLENFTHDSVFAPGYSQLLAVALGGFLMGTAIIDSATKRINSNFVNTMRVGIRLGSGVVILLIGLSFKDYGGFWLHILSIFVVLCQIAFDLLYSPYTQSEEGILTASDAARRAEQEAEDHDKLMFKDAKDARRTIFDDPIKVGLPPSAGSDLYYYFVNASWSKLTLALVLIYLAINVVFAVLYLLAPGTIAGGTLNQFMDAFFFSVQTMATIGYGALTPVGGYSNFIVTIEAAVGLLGTAVITGLVFAKISKPQAKVIFSDNILIHNLNGKRTMTLRLGNIRGNDIIEARVHVSVLKQEKTLEGEVVNRIHELKLVRSTSPTMRLTWNIYHEIDEDSVFYGHHADTDFGGLLGLFVIVTGHDGTYSNTIQARKPYAIDEILEDRYFADIITRTREGRAMVDFNYFHELKAPKRKLAKSKAPDHS